MHSLLLQAKTRPEIGKQNHALRDNGLIPAIIYGHGFKNINLTVNYGEFESVYGYAGESSLIDLKIDKEQNLKAIIADVQKDPLTDRFIHIDFRKVKMDEKIKAEVNLEFINESPAVKDLNGVLVKALDKVEIECLPASLINKIDVDVSSLKTFNDVIRVADLNISPEVEVLTAKETAVALVEEMAKIEEEKTPTEAEEESEEQGEKQEEESDEKQPQEDSVKEEQEKDKQLTDNK